MSWIARAIGNLGASAGEAHDINLDWRAKEQNLAAQRAQMQMEQILGPLRVQELQQQIKRMGQPQVGGTFQTDDGSVYATVIDADTGQPSSQRIYKGDQKYPNFKSLQEAEAWALTHGDQPFLGAVQNAIKSTQREPQKPASTQEYDDFIASLKRKHGPNYEPTAQDILAFRHPPKADTPGGDDSMLKALADKWMNEGIKPPAKYQAPVEKYMAEHNMKAKTKLTAQEQNATDVIKQALPMMDQVIGSLEPHKAEGTGNAMKAMLSSALMRADWQLYNSGFKPMHDWTLPYFQIAALVRVMNTQQFLRGIRNMNFVTQIQQHMPNPEKDTPALAYDKAVRMKTLMSQMQREYTSDNEGSMDSQLDAVFGKIR